MAFLNQPNNYISSLISAGSDAQVNLYYVEISSRLSDNDDFLKTGLKVRNKDFSFPGFTHGTYTVNYMTTSANFPSAQMTGTKEFTLNLRVDANWEVYNFLLQQQARTSAGTLAFATNSVPDATEGGMEISVYALDKVLEDADYLDPTDQSGFTLMYKFKYCWIKSIAPISFSYDGSTPITAQATIAFFDVEDAQNLLLGEEE